MRYRDDSSGEEYIPWVIETSGGVDRAALFFLINSYREDGKRIVLAIHPLLAPIKVAVFPLVANKIELVNKAQTVYRMLKTHFVTAWDDRGNIGKRYLAQDEVGTPWCVTIDYTSLTDDTVTVRDRDTTKQERVNISNLPVYFQQKLSVRVV